MIAIKTFLFIIIFSISTFVVAQKPSPQQESSSSSSSFQKALTQEDEPTLNHANSFDRSRRTTNFEWNPVSNAKSYEVEITPIGRSDGKNQPYSFNVNTPSLDAELKPGHYSMRLRSKDKRNVPGEWSVSQDFQVKLYAPKLIEPLPQDEIVSTSAETHALVLKWEVQSEASKYKIFIEDENKNIIQSLETTTNQITTNLPVAKKYRWSIIGFDKEANEGETLAESIPFTIIGKAITTPKIIQPETPFLREISWEESDYAQKYIYTLYRREKVKNRKWIRYIEGETKNTTLPFDSKWKGGEYKLSVSAQGTLRSNSKTHSLTFNVANGNRTIAAEKRALLRKSIIRTNEWYFIASYFITTIQYQSQNGDKATASSFSAFGGTGRLGLGYFTLNNPYGFLGVIDYSGFTIDNNTYKYPSLEVHGTYRFTSESIGELRASGGLFIKEIPELIGTSSTDFSVKSINILGLHAGGEYWYPLTSKLGLQLNGRIYYPLNGKTPTGAKINSSPSYQFGFLGSLKLNENATGLMGYAYRKEQTNYKVTNTNSINAGYTTNTNSIVGHYLNFLLEWDL